MTLSERDARWYLEVASELDAALQTLACKGHTRAPSPTKEACPPTALQEACSPALEEACPPGPEEACPPKQAQPWLVVRFATCLQEPASVEAQYEAQYQEGAILGEGTYGQVRQAKRQSDGQGVAVKVLKDHGDQTGALSEVALLDRLCHVNLVRLLDVFPSPTTTRLVFEFGGRAWQSTDRHTRAFRTKW